MDALNRIRSKMTVSANFGSKQCLDPDTLWCTWPAESPIVDQFGAATGIALFDIGHLGVAAEDFLGWLKTTAAWQQAGLIFLVDRENKLCLRNELIHDFRIHVWDSAVYDHNRFHAYLPWFDWATSANIKLGLINQLTDPLIARPRYLFDCVMGQSKRHREYLYAQICDYDYIKTNTLLNYLGRGHTYQPAAEYDAPVVTNNMSLYGWQNDLRSPTYAIIPYKIYNQSWFSLVTESRDHNNGLITEKLAKPLLSRRVFVLFGAHHHLRDLRRLGFQTFAPVIDESYDEIEDCETRWASAWQAVKELAEQDPCVIWEKLRPIAIHNQAVARATNWWNKMHTQMFQIANAHNTQTVSDSRAI